MRTKRALLVFLVRTLYATESDSGVVRKDGRALPLHHETAAGVQNELWQESEAWQQTNPNNSTQELTLVRRHDGIVSNGSHASVRKEVSLPSRPTPMQHTREGVAVEIDARANVVRPAALERDGDIATERLEGVVRSAVVEAAGPVDQPRPSPEQLEPLEHLGLLGRNSSMVSAGLRHAHRAFAELRNSLLHLRVDKTLTHALTELRQGLAGRKMHLTGSDAVRTVLWAVFIIIVVVVTLMAVRVAIARNREQSQWSQSHSVAMMRAINSNANAPTGGQSMRPRVSSDARNQLGSPRAQIGPMTSMGRRQSTGSSGVPALAGVGRAGGATVRSSSGRRQSASGGTQQ